MQAVHVLCLLQVLLATDTSSPPRYIIDLDQPPEERWAEVAEDYSGRISRVLAELEELFSKEVVLAVTSLVGNNLQLDKYFPYPYANELSGFVKYSGNNVTMGTIVTMNLYYDLLDIIPKKDPTIIGAWLHNQRMNHVDSGACGSIIASDKNGMLLHGHNMDSFFHDTLKDLIIEVQFKNKHNPNVFTSTTIAGFIGVSLGAKPGAFSISVNTRHMGEWWENVVSILKEGGFHGIAGLRVRDVLQTEGIDFEYVIQHLSTTSLIRPYYFIVAGVTDAQGVVITRDRITAVDKWYIDPPNRWYLIQTNYDHWNSPPADDDRRNAGIEAIDSVSRAGINVDSLYTVLSTPPLLRNHTYVTTIIIPKEGSEFYYNSTIRYV